VIPQLLRQAQTGGSLVIFGDGTQTRDFVYVDDVVDALVAAATATEVNRAVINIGSGREVSINELASLVARVTAKKISVLHNQTQSGGVSRLVADVTLASRSLGWTPGYDLEAGLRLTLQGDPRFR
jgi:UDP-glucose 4-epimerase